MSRSRLRWELRTEVERRTIECDRAADALLLHARKVDSARVAGDLEFQRLLVLYLAAAREVDRTRGDLSRYIRRGKAES